MKYARWGSRLAPGGLAAVGLLALSLGGKAPIRSAALFPSGGPGGRQSGLAAREARQAAELQPGGRLATLGEAVTRARYRVAPDARQPGTFAADNPAQALRARFHSGGVELTACSPGSAGERRVGLRTLALGRGSQLRPVTPGRATARENRVEYARQTSTGAAVTEWYVNAPEGVEQGFTVATAPGTGEGSPLTVSLAVDGDLKPVVAADGQAVSFQDRAGAGVMCGAGLKAWDATGRDLPITWKAEGGSPTPSDRWRVQIPRMKDERELALADPDPLHPSAFIPHPPQLTLQVNDENAVYPVTIDPTYTQQQRLTEPAGDAADYEYFGWSVALDGDTAVVGAYQDNPDLGAGAIPNAGAAYVFFRTAGVWTLQQKLTAPPAEANSGDLFGTSVAVDGDTVVVGAQTADPDLGSGPINNAGAAYVFTRSGGTWTLQAKLTAPASDAGAGDFFGFAVALDGDTAVVGASFAAPNLGAGAIPNAGAAYVFTRSGTIWTQQARLTEPPADISADDYFGSAVAVDRDTVVVGVYVSDGTAGAAYVFTRSGTAWTMQQKLVGMQAPSNFGNAVAVAGDTVVVGAPWETEDLGAGALPNAGAAYVFTRSGTVWTQQAKLTELPGDAAQNETFGNAVALDGDNLVVGASGDTEDGVSLTGAVYVFTRSGTIWTQQAKLTEPPGDTGMVDSFGWSVALDGSTVLMGATDKSLDLGAGLIQSVGAAYVFQTDNQPPVAQADKTLPVPADTLTGLSITAPTDPDGNSLTLTVNTVPDPSKGVVRKPGGGAVVAVSDTLTEAELTGLEFHSVSGQTGAAGTFSYTVSDGNGGSASQTVTIQISAITLAAPATGTTGLPLVVQWTAPPGQSAVDWVGFFRTDVPGPLGYLAWTWTGGTTTGAFTVTPPTAGTYVFRYYLNDGGTLAATSGTVTVTDPPAADYTVTVSPATVGPGGSVTVSWTASTARPATDWIGLYSSSTPGPAGYLTWFYTGGIQSGSKTLKAPNGTGTYVARYYLQDGGMLGATSNTLTVSTASPDYSVTPGVTSVATGGTLMVSWTAPVGRPATDWVALVRTDQVQAGPPQVITGYVKWAYTGGTASGSTTFNLTGVAPGTYQVAYLLNDSFSVGALGATVTVMP